MLKICGMSVQLGVAVAVAGAVGLAGAGAGAAQLQAKALCEQLFGGGGAERFAAALRESGPFLASAELDKLVVALKAAGFFDAFVYDSRGRWRCVACVGDCPAMRELLAAPTRGPLAAGPAWALQPFHAVLLGSADGGSGGAGAGAAAGRRVG